MRHNTVCVGKHAARDSKRAENDNTSFSAHFGSFCIRFCSKHCRRRARKPLILLIFFAGTVSTLVPVKPLENTEFSRGSFFFSAGLVTAKKACNLERILNGAEKAVEKQGQNQEKR